jgi:hypothetical protein
MIGFIDHLQIITTSNYNATANSRTLHFTTARTKSYQPDREFIFRFGREI